MTLTPKNVKDIVRGLFKDPSSVVFTTYQSSTYTEDVVVTVKTGNTLGDEYEVRVMLHPDTEELMTEVQPLYSSELGSLVLH